MASSQNLILSGLPIYVARIPATPFPRTPFSFSLDGAVKFWFWFLWCIDAVVAAVALYFFFSLAASGRIASFNILPWLAILAVLTAVVGGSVWLRSAGQHVVAIVVLLALAIPAGLIVLLFVLLLILRPNFH